MMKMEGDKEKQSEKRETRKVMEERLSWSFWSMLTETF